MPNHDIHGSTSDGELDEDCVNESVTRVQAGRKKATQVTIANVVGRTALPTVVPQEASQLQAPTPTTSPVDGPGRTSDATNEPS
jgi:hypothetical protein